MPDIRLYGGEPNPNDVVLRDPTAAAAEVQGGPLTVVGTPDVVVAASQLEVTGGVILVAGSGSVVVASSTREVVADPLVVAGAGLVLISSDQQDVLGGIVGVDGASTIVVADGTVEHTAVDVQGGPISLNTDADTDIPASDLYPSGQTLPGEGQILISDPVPSVTFGGFDRKWSATSRLPREHLIPRNISSGPISLSGEGVIEVLNSHTNNDSEILLVAA